MKIIEFNPKSTQTLIKRKFTDSIILHHAEARIASVEDINRWHKYRGFSCIGYHYYIRKNGSVYMGRPENAVGAHAGSKNSYNSHSIGICFEGNFMIEFMDDVQLRSGIELIESLSKKYTIKDILGHRNVTSTDCPGINFPLKSFQNYKNEEEIEDMTKNETIGLFNQMLDERIPVYKTVKDVPDWAKPTITFLLQKGYLIGDKDIDATIVDDNEINLTLSEVRQYVVNYRAGNYK